MGLLPAVGEVAAPDLRAMCFFWGPKPLVSSYGDRRRVLRDAKG